MKQKDVIKAFHAINKYEEKQTPLKVSYALFKVKKAIADQVEFQQKQEIEIFKKYQPVQQEDGSLQFESNEKAKEFATEMSTKIDELGDIEVDMSTFKKPQISLDQLVEMSVEDIEALEPFIEFVE